MKKTNQCLANAGTIKYMLVLTTLSLAFFFTSCNSGDKKKEEPANVTKQTVDGAQGFQMNCVMLSRAQVQAWVDSGWTKPGSDNQIKDIMLQFYSADASQLGSNLQMMGYPAMAPDNVKRGGMVILDVDKNCSVKGFTGPVVFGNNEAIISNLNILNADGSLKEFDYIRFTPQQVEKFSPYITFNIDVMKGGEVMAGGGSGGTIPCPPMCCPPTCSD
jgi:hypothetical protein